MKLYYFPLSTYSQKVLLGFHEKGLSFTPELTQLFDADVAARYREIYPLGKIPLLLLDDGHRIPESSIILEYLDQHHPQSPPLIPTDPEQSRQTRFHDRMFDLYLNDPVVTQLFESWKPEEQRDTAAISKARGRVEVIYAFIEQRLAARDWIMDCGYSLADIAATPALFYAQQVQPFDQRPAVAAYWERLSARPSWRKVMAEAEPHLARLHKAG